MGYRTFLCIIVLMLAIPSAAGATAEPGSKATPQAAGSSTCYLDVEAEHTFDCDEIDKIKAEVDRVVDEKKDDDDEEWVWALVIIVFIIAIFIF